MNKDMIIVDKEIYLRRLKDIESDYRYLEKWYQEKEVYLSFEQRILSYNEIKTKYYVRTLDNTKIPVYMIEHKNTPIGIIQYKKIDKELYNFKEDNIYELDIFIGETNLHNKGIGHKVINKMCEYLFKEKNAEVLVMCPLKENKRAIKCYEKCGFIIEKEYEDVDTIGNKQIYVEMVKLY